MKWPYFRRGEALLHSYEITIINSHKLYQNYILILVVVTS